MADMTTTCETCGRLGQTPDADHLERVRTLARSQGAAGWHPSGLRLGERQEQVLRGWPLERIRPKSVALGVRSLLAEVCALRAQLAPPRTLRTIPPDVQSTHWEDSGDTRGCWASHVECSIRRVETLTAERDAIQAAYREQGIVWVQDQEMIERLTAERADLRRLVDALFADGERVSALEPALAASEQRRTALEAVVRQAIEVGADWEAVDDTESAGAWQLYSLPDLMAAARATLAGAPSAASTEDAAVYPWCDRCVQPLAACQCAASTEVES